MRIVGNGARVYKEDDAWGRWQLEYGVTSPCSGSSEIKDLCSLNKAATDFGIPEPTLRRYVKKEPNDYPLNLGRYRPVFSAELEDKLATYLVELGKRYYGMTNLQVRKFACC